jgi:hypothetical protein
VGAETGTEAALKMALAEAHVPGVREAPARYAPIRAARLAPPWGLGARAPELPGWATSLAALGSATIVGAATARAFARTPGGSGMPRGWTSASTTPG